MVCVKSTFLSTPSATAEGAAVEPPNIVPEAEILSVGADDEDSFEGIDELWSKAVWQRSRRRVKR